jgi:hypothetical protein
MNGRSGFPSGAAGPSWRAAASAGHRSSPDPAGDLLSPSATSSHPLSMAGSALTVSLDEQTGPSTRPALERRTTETTASSGDQAGAADTGRNTPTDAGLRRRSIANGSIKGKDRELAPQTGDTPEAVEVLIHQVHSCMPRTRRARPGSLTALTTLSLSGFSAQLSATDSLPRIALQYGIDVRTLTSTFLCSLFADLLATSSRLQLAVLRKTNKLWTSDSLHVRRTLYIPLSACHLREELVRGPAEDEVTLLQARSAPRPDLVKDDAVDGAQRTPRSAHSRAATTPDLAFRDTSPDAVDGQDNPWLLDGTNVSYAADRFADSLASLMPPLPASATVSPTPSPPPSTPPPPRASRRLKVVLIDRKELSFFPRSAPASGRASLDSSLMQLKRSTPASTAGRTRPSSTTTHSPSLSRKISNLFLDVPATLGLPGPLSPTSPSLPQSNGRPSLYGRQRSASDYGRGASNSSRTSLDLGSPPAAEHVELAALAPPPSRKADWFSSVGRAGPPDGVIRQQVAPKQPMLVVRDPRQNHAGRKVGDGLGDGRIKDVWIG